MTKTSRSSRRTSASRRSCSRGADTAIDYSGILDSQLRGFYLSKTKTHRCAVTQFEPTDARRAFPSFDEPALKAKFTVTLVAPKGDMAISNTNAV